MKGKGGEGLGDPEIYCFICEWETNGLISMDEVITYTVETETFTLPKLTKDGFVFVGWTGSNGIIPQLSVVIEKGFLGNRTYKQVL